MSRRDVTIWTCDGCSSNMETNPGKPPLGWRAVSIDRNDDSGTYEHQGHYCGPCTVRIRSALSVPTAPDTDEHDAL